MTSSVNGIVSKYTRYHIFDIINIWYHTYEIIVDIILFPYDITPMISWCAGELSYHRYDCIGVWCHTSWASRWCTRLVTGWLRGIVASSVAASNGSLRLRGADGGADMTVAESRNCVAEAAVIRGGCVAAGCGWKIFWENQTYIDITGDVRYKYRKSYPVSGPWRRQRLQVGSLSASASFRETCLLVIRQADVCLRH